ncbi:16S rRNA (cytosine(1402)-N(4))-methyltransferase RsmH [Magnetospira sp. QH-2]|uniref:16S rRNA (cytosine(1402)-N(4))-methyltransferase RsmH n=1 Tax=Magnetospira sp. (strain QH-2) TaxID=1288970 RepID=UPI0003E8140E|nr:16S rRNA (cytosine(1402)-N(4))-methyltransferase RsmH [Magnetospira sp. QH-2]CCQ72812.1 S-adenosyl-dependent methyl transferase [Magnetospira sp. QH-2]
MSIPDTPHIPVLLREVVTALAPRHDALYVDGTFGAGGYTRALLDATRCRVYGIDRDPTAIAAGQALAQQYDGRLTLVPGRFGDMVELMAERDIGSVDGVALDIGVSSMQVDTPERGFSFRFDAPLDMRMGDEGPTAADLVNRLPEAELADIIYQYGEERGSRRIARAVCTDRVQTPFERTGQLADLVKRVVGRPNDKIHPATRTFQALRIAVNDELGELHRGLDGAERLLSPGGRLAVVSFHSLEDRAVKQFLKQRSGGADNPSRHRPGGDTQGPAPSFKLIKRGAVKPGDEETRMNPRARSARLRIAERTSAPVWPSKAAA